MNFRPSASRLVVPHVPHVVRHVVQLSLITVALAAATGCIFVAPPRDDPGDITFLWSFEGEPSCINARVDEIDVTVTDAGGTVARSSRQIVCEGGGLTLENFVPGSYTVLVEAFDDRGNLLFSGGASALVPEGGVADLGVLELTRGDPTKGDIAFLWSFAGEPTCTGAGVAQVEIELVQGNTVVQTNTEECFGGGLIVNDLDPGTYSLFIDAYASDNEYLFAATVDVTVVAGQTVDLGTVLLSDVGMNAAMGVLSLEFGFLYPATLPESDCATAGVLNVDVVFIDGPGGSELNRVPVPCDVDSVATDLTLEPGAYDFYLVAYGDYLGDDVLLYDTADLNATVVADQANDLGQIPLDRVTAGFADIRIEHTLPAGETCASLGLDDMTFTVTRLVTNELVDDSGMFSCSDTFLMRETFVPGSYRVDIDGTGTNADYVGTATLNVAPDSVTLAEVNVVSS